MRQDGAVLWMYGLWVGVLLVLVLVVAGVHHPAPP